MVHQREGGGNISSPHLVKYSREKPPKIGRCDPYWIIIFFFVHLNSLKVEKVEESTHGTILLVGPNLENWGLKSSGSILRHKMMFFGGKIFQI